MLYKFNEEGFKARTQQQDNGCILWTGAVNQAGFGTFTYGCTSKPAHRMAWLRAGKELGENDLLRHSCGNKLCVNPEHLYIKTKKTKNKQLLSSLTPFKPLKPEQQERLLAALRAAQRHISV